MKVTFGSQWETLGQVVNWGFILAEPVDDVEKFLKETIRRLSEDKYVGKDPSAEYYFEIAEVPTSFDIEIQVVMNAFIEKYEKLIKDISIDDMYYHYQMKNINYLGDSYYYCKRILVKERYNSNREICQIHNCRFYGLFDSPLNLKTVLREGVLQMKEKGYRMQFLFEPTMHSMPENSKEKEISPRYDGVIHVFYMNDEKILTIKGIFSFDPDGPIVFPDSSSANPLENALYYLNCCMVNPIVLRDITPLSDICGANHRIKLRTKTGKMIRYTLRDMPKAINDLNDFFKFRNAYKNDIWDDIVEYVHSICADTKEFVYWRSGTAIQLKCEMDSSKKISFTLDTKNALEEFIFGAKYIVYDKDMKVTMHLQLPYLYEDKKQGLALYPNSVMLFFDEPNQKRIIISDKNSRMRKIVRYFEKQKWDITDLCGNNWICNRNLKVFIRFLMENCAEKSEEEGVPAIGENITKKVKEILAKDSSLSVGEEIIRNICVTSTQYLSWKFQESININQPSPYIPNYVFLGGPGSGKSSLVRKLAQDVFEAKFYETTPSELMGLYIGHTRGVFLEKLNELQNQRGYGPDAPAILFLDEAYTLFAENGRNNSFVQDIMGVLLTVMQRKEQKISYQIEKYDEDGKAKTINRTIVIKPNTVIWMAGYEKVMRKALSSNQGIFRRVKVITLPEPTVDDLWDCFSIITKQAGKENLDLIRAKKVDILKYFRWGASMEHAEFFGNYSGAKRLAENMVNALYLMDSHCTKEEKEKELAAILEDQKKEIRRQYQVVIRKNERLPFEIVSDLKETLDDYIGNASVREQMSEIVDMMVDAEFYQKRHISIPKGALLMGCPGTGKTYLAKCMAGELSKRLQERNISKHIAFIPVAGTELHEEELVSCLFRTAEEYEAAILFIDEIDAIGKRRTLMPQDGSLIQLMKEMDGFDERKTIFILAATNAPEILDPALKRAGRFDMQYEIGYPNRTERMALLQYYGKDVIHDFRSDILEESGRISSGFSPASIREIMNESVLLYYQCEKYLEKGEDGRGVVCRHRLARDEENYEGAVKVMVSGREYWKHDTKNNTSAEEENLQQDLFLKDLKEVIAKKSFGERRSIENENEEFQCNYNRGRSSVAIHECGHAMICAWQNMSIEKITVLARNVTSGYVGITPAGIRTRNDILKQIKVALGGRAAEEIIYGEDISVGACDDLWKATELARSMVAKFGMGNKIGIISLMEENGEYLGKENKYTCAPEYRNKVDEEIRELLEMQYKEVCDYLKKEKETLCRMAKYIFLKEEVSGADFQTELVRLR